MLWQPCSQHVTEMSSLTPVRSPILQMRKQRCPKLGLPKTAAIFKVRQRIQISVYKLGNPDESKIAIAQNPTTIYEYNNLSGFSSEYSREKKWRGTVG